MYSPSTPCHFGPMGDHAHVLRLHSDVEEQQDLLALRSTHQPAQTTTSVPRGITGHQPSRWTSPTRHVLAIINFQDLADLSTRLSSSPDNIDYLDAECRTYLGTFDEISLFTWYRHFEPNELSHVSVRNLCHQISTRIRDTWNIQIPEHTLELRGADEDDETVQIADEVSRASGNPIDSVRLFLSFNLS